MGPLRSLLRWGATVAAVDLPRPEVWTRLLDGTRGAAGRLLVPATRGSGPLAQRAGVDLVHDLPTATGWVCGLDGSLVLGNYVYADGATNVRVSTAVDAMSRIVRLARADTALSFLATPTDVFAVPKEAVDASVRSYAERSHVEGAARPAPHPVGWSPPAPQLRPGRGPRHQRLGGTPAGPELPAGEADPALAGHVRAGRGGHGCPSRSPRPPAPARCFKNRGLAAAYAGAHRFGVEVFDPGTANTLMAALLVHDLVAGSPAQEHPWQAGAYAAAHGGLWRAAYDPRSALGLAALLGAASARP